MKLSVKNVLIISFIFHVITAIFSTGFQQFDEHFQIYEFLNFKLGNSPASDLPWEYKNQMRPWFQVFVFYLVYKPLSFMGISSPFTFAFIFRLISSLLGWISLVSLYPLIKRWFKRSELAIALVHLSWFTPYILTRSSSESFGISFFLLGMSLFLGSKSGLLSGFLLGLSHISRFQMALPVAFLWFWGLLSKKVEKRALFTSAIGVLLAIGLGFLIDSWGYGIWTFSLWHYFENNILKGALDSLGVDPWYTYFKWSFLRGFPLIGLPLILGALWFWIKKWRHPLTWITLPYFLLHTYLGHKEIRFIFFVTVLSPLCFMYLLEKVDWWEKRWFKITSKIVIGFNIVLLVGVSFRAANPSVDFYRYIYNSDITEIYAKDEDPFTMVGLPLNFYKKKGFKTIVGKIEDYSKKYVFFKRGSDVFRMEKEHPECELKYLTYPKFSLKLNIGNWLSRSRVWSLFHCP